VAGRSIAPCRAREPELEIRRGGDNVFRGDDPLARRLPRPETREHVVAAGGLGHFGHPADAADERVVPFLEIDLRPRPPARRGLRFHKSCLVRLGDRLRLVARAHKRAERPDHREDAGDVPLVQGVNGCPRADELGDDVRLQIREGRDKIGLKRENFDDVGRDERRDARLLARTWRGLTA
jgi:hypothetical protein